MTNKIRIYGSKTKNHARFCQPFLHKKERIYVHINAKINLTKTLENETRLNNAIAQDKTAKTK